MVKPITENAEWPVHEKMADDKEGYKINGKTLSDLRVVDLRKELDKRGLSKGGSKQELTDRLQTVRIPWIMS